MTVLWLVASTIGLLVLLGAAYFGPPLLVRRRQVAAVRRAGRTRLALTFDDGPDRELTPAVLDMLATHGVKASFFLVGSRTQDAPDVCDRIVAEGHEVATHSHAHRNAWRVGPWTALRDAVAGYDSLCRWCSPNAMFRPPFGKCTTPVLAAMRRRGAPVVWWTHVAEDTSDVPPDPEAVASRVLHDGGILLMHSRHRMAPRRAYLLQLLQLLLERGNAQGVTFCKASELLHA